ncbi:hypothetical protein PCASD_21550, partial [Puccinia coronata f. sp. avenae]
APTARLPHQPPCAAPSRLLAPLHGPPPPVACPTRLPALLPPPPACAATTTLAGLQARRPLAHPPVTNGLNTIQANQRRLRINCCASTPPDLLQSEASKAL